METPKKCWLEAKFGLKPVRMYALPLLDPKTMLPKGQLWVRANSPLASKILQAAK